MTNNTLSRFAMHLLTSSAKYPYSVPDTSYCNAMCFWIYWFLGLKIHASFLNERVQLEIYFGIWRGKILLVNFIADQNLQRFCRRHQLVLKMSLEFGSWGSIPQPSSHLSCCFARLLFHLGWAKSICDLLRALAHSRPKINSLELASLEKRLGLPNEIKTNSDQKGL